MDSESLKELKSNALVLQARGGMFMPCDSFECVASFYCGLYFRSDIDFGAIFLKFTDWTKEKVEQKRPFVWWRNVIIWHEENECGIHDKSLVDSFYFLLHTFLDEEILKFEGTDS